MPVSAAVPDALPSAPPLNVWQRVLVGLPVPAAALLFWPRLPLDAYDAPKLGALALLLAVLPWSALPRLRGWLLPGLALVLLPAALAAPDAGGFWFGSVQRSQGALALLLCVLVCVWATSAGRWTASVLHGAQWAVLLAGSLTLLQYPGMDPLGTAAPRPPASMGNTVLLGQWLVLLLPLCLWSARQPHMGQWARWWSWLVLLVGGLALLASGSRGPLLALLLVGLLGWPAGKGVRRLRMLVLLVGLALATALLWLRPASMEHRVQLWGDAIAVLQAPPARLWPDGSVDPWQAWRLWLGYGADLQVMPMRAVADAVPATAAAERFSEDPDRAHNLLLDALLRYGLLGVAGAAVLAGGLWRSLRALPLNSDSLARALALGLLAWLSSLGSGFAGSADSLTAALLLGLWLARLPVSSAAPEWSLPPVVMRAVRVGMLLAGLLVWWLPAKLLPLPWRAPEQAVLAFEQARQQLALARGSADPGRACAAGHVALLRLQLAVRSDPTRPEYLQALQQSRRVWCGRCAAVEIEPQAAAAWCDV